MTKLIIQSIRQTILWSVVAGVMYPIVMTVFAQVAFHNQANGSLVEKDGKIAWLRVVGPAVSGHQLLLAATIGLRLRHWPDGHRGVQWQQPGADQRDIAHQCHE